MKKAFVLLSFSAALLACSSNTEQTSSQSTETSSQPTENTLATEGSAEEQPQAALNPDSAVGADVSATAHQPQVNTSVNDIGTEPTGVPVGGKGGKLIAASDCGGCHREGEKLLGPAYVAVAEKYPDTKANIDMLAKKVITGGKGNWGEIAMTPHPDLKEADAKEMVTYILSLK
ncbi:c-type cytochrome [Hymenobacter crusticola]|uniref:c-type cytochrome n=1 Tax=Hymenobacter crusticola TaxID=1770526 RepID=UPI000A360256|nr:c-type cytochrome [Hymenobacter crusticola]